MHSWAQHRSCRPCSAPHGRCSIAKSEVRSLTAHSIQARPVTAHHKESESSPVNQTSTPGSSSCCYMHIMHEQEQQRSQPRANGGVRTSFSASIRRALQTGCIDGASSSLLASSDKVGTLHGCSSNLAEAIPHHRHPVRHGACKHIARTLKRLVEGLRWIKPATRMQAVAMSW